MPEPPAVAGRLYEAAVVGVPWRALAIFSGDQPITYGTGTLPDWAEVEYKPTYARISGVPPEAGTYTFSVAATNKSRAVVVEQFEVVVTEPPPEDQP